MFKKKKVRLKWTPEEKKKLLELVKKYGENNWLEIYKQYSENILKSDIKFHYCNVLNPNLEKREFTKEEDEIIL